MTTKLTVASQSLSRKILASIAMASVVALISVPAAHAEGEQGADAPRAGKRAGKRAGRRGHKRGGKRAFKRFDKNEDGVLTQDEVPEKLWTRIAKADTNSDGQVSREEAKAACKGKRGRRGRRGKRGARRAKMAKRFKQLDTNGDKALAQNEVPEKAWARLAKADANEDGVVTRDELKAKMKERLAAHFAKADANQDGVLSEDEVSARRWKRLSRADANEDGAVSREEIQAAHAKRREACKARRAERSSTK